jgi:hypothetical protein
MPQHSPEHHRGRLIQHAADATEITVPHQNRPLETPSPERIRRLRRHLIESLRDLRRAKRPDRLIQQPAPTLPDPVKTALQAGCATCQGHCCLGGGEHAYLDDRTMARVRRDRPDLDVRGIIQAYVRHVARLSYEGSCLFHGAAGCTLDPSLRATLCSTYYCDDLTLLLRSPIDPARVVFRATAPRPPAKSGR